MASPLARRFAFLLLVAVAPAARAAEWPVPRGPSREPVPYRYDPAAWKKVPPGFLDDAQACTLYSGISYLVEADGTIETVTHEVTRLNSRKALDKLGEYRNISYTPAYEKLTLNEARIHKPDGRAVPVEPKHVQLRDLGTDFQVYDQGKQLVISFPTLEVGDVIEVRWTVRGKNPEHGGHFFTRYTFGDDKNPVAADEVRVRVPKDKPFKFKTVNGKLEPAVKDENGFKTYHWRVTDRAPLPQDDSLPSKETLRQQLLCSTFASWDEVYQWKQKLRKDCWECTPEIKKVVAQVTKDLKLPVEKARALTYWVRQNVRYVSVGERHDYTPHAPAVVLGNRYGDCKDTSQLLAVMLREAGLNVGLATLATVDDGQIEEDLPSPWGTHAILVVTIDGKKHWIDTTASLAGWDFLPRDDRDRNTYVVSEDGLRLMRTPKMTADDNRIEQTTRLTVGPDGSTHAERTAVYHGNAALSRRNDWVDVPAGERRRLVASELQDAQNTARLLRLAIDEDALRAYDGPVKAQIVFDVPDQFPGDTDREGSITDSPIWGRLLAYTFEYDRAVALELGNPFESVHKYVIQLPPGYRLDKVPANREMKSKWGSFQLTVKADPDTPRLLEVEYRTRVEQKRIEPADLEEFRKFQEYVSKHYRVWLTLKPGHDAGDIPVLEAVLAVTPGDRDAAELLANLYIDDEKLADARRVLQRARYYHPKDAALAELAVHAAGSDAEEEAAHRELVKHFPETLRYAVALADLLVERGKYDDVRKVLEPVLKDGTAAEAAAAHFHLARAAAAQGKHREALKQLDAARDADADTAATVNYLQLRAQVHEKLSQPKEAAEAYRGVLKLEPNSNTALAALVRLELANKNADEALAYLRRYTLTVAGDPVGMAHAADLHLRLGRTEDALDLASRAAEAGGEPRADRVLGLVALKRGDFESAVKHLKDADLDAEVLEGLVRANLALGRLTDAAAAAEKARKVEDATPEMRRLVAAAAELAKRRNAVLAAAKIPAGKGQAYQAAADAVVCAEHAASEGRPTAEVEALLALAFRDGVELAPAYALRGQLHAERGRLLKAAADADKALALTPKEARGLFVRGRVRLERGDKEALADLQTAAVLSERKDATVLHWLAAAQYRGGQKAAAVATQREAVKLRPKDRELAEQLEEFEKDGKGAAGGE